MEPINKNWVNEDGSPSGGVSTGIGFTIAWQRGALNVAGRNGAFLLEVLQACRSQIQHYQLSSFACEENLKALEHLDEAIFSLESRRDRREAKGTLGTHQPD